jgi:hypothetical protein
MIFGEHGNRFEARRVIDGRGVLGCPYWLLIYALPSSNVGMSSGKLELPDRVPKPELGNQ